MGAEFEGPSLFPLGDERCHFGKDMELKFAPLVVPWERRLQTLAVFHYVFMFIVMPLLSTYLTVAILFSSYWWIMALYALWMFYDFRTPEEGSRPKRWMRSWVAWKYYVDYFPIKLIKTADLPPEHNYLVGSHPHGILSFGAFATLCTDATGFREKFPGIESYLATLNGQFWWPFRREEVLLTGAVASSKRSINYILGQGKGRAVGIVLGGAEEVLDSNPDSYDLNLSKRKGFIKIALQNGAHLVPMYNFGENKTYSQVVPNCRGSPTRKLQIAVKNYCGFCPPLINGRGIFNYSFGILPRRTPINTVVGRPIMVKRDLNPSQQDIDRLHNEYCNELRKLFDEHKGKYGIDENTYLNIY